MRPPLLKIILWLSHNLGSTFLASFYNTSLLVPM